MSNEYQVRCPVCLARNAVIKTIAVNKALKCVSCKRHFIFKDALAVNTGLDLTLEKSASDFEKKDSTPLGIFGWLVSLLTIVIASIAIRKFIQPFDTIDFTVFYIIFGIIVLMLTTLIRWYWRNIIAVSLLGLIFFEIIGVIRYFETTSNGVFDFDSSIITMLLFGIVFFIRAHHVSSLNNFEQCSTVGCGSGCGGGCGGCGG